MLGLLTWIGAGLGALMALNLWLGLYSAPGEWPWTYALIVIVQLLFAIKTQGARRRSDNVRRTPRTIRLAFLEVPFDARHLVCQMSEAEHGSVSRTSKGVKCGSLHFDRKRAVRSRVGYGVLRLTIRCISRP